MRLRIVFCAASLGCALGIAAGAPTAAAGNPQVELAQRYAPVVRLVRQEKPCGHGEPFEPTDVDLVLGNPEVALHGPWSTSYVVKVAPTARNLAGGLSGYHLDFPGNALAPGCVYDDWSHRLNAGHRARMYAHIVTERGYPGRLALQYWFFYVFNDFNDKHEGDWEMIQLDFDAATPAAALRVRPALVGYSQHQGAESARWGEHKLQLVDGTHPVVYPALGSHANYFSSALYLGRSAAQGLGCDDTRGPWRQLRPAVSLIPTGRATYLAAFPWLGFAGGWGEQHQGFYGGPTGPNTKLQWTKPFSWAEESWRDQSFTVPAGTSVGTTATGFFCGAVATGSSVLTALVGNPSPILIALAVLVAFFVWLASRTRWHDSAPFPARRRRRWGSIVTSSRRLYASRPRLFLGIGLVFVPLGLLITGVQALIFRLGGLAPLVDSAGSSNAFVAALAIMLGTFFTVLGLTVVQITTALAIVELDSGRDVRTLDAYTSAIGRLPRVLGVVVCEAILVALASLTAFGVAVALWLVIRWSLISQVSVIEGRGGLAALRRSGRLVRGNWWRVASLVVFVVGVGLLLGPFVGTVLLFVTSASFNFVNLVSSAVYAIALPFVAIATTYLYFDLAEAAESETEDAPAERAAPVAAT